MMRGVFQLGGGPGVVLEGTIVVALVAIYQLLRVRLSRWWAVLATVLIAVFPPVLGYLTALQRDVWFGSTALMTYALLVRGRALVAQGAPRCGPGSRSCRSGSPWPLARTRYRR